MNHDTRFSVFKNRLSTRLYMQSAESAKVQFRRKKKLRSCLISSTEWAKLDPFRPRHFILSLSDSLSRSAPSELDLCAMHRMLARSCGCICGIQVSTSSSFEGRSRSSSPWGTSERRNDLQCKIRRPPPGRSIDTISIPAES